MAPDADPAAQRRPAAFAEPDEFEKFVEARRLSANGLMWQVPGLSLTAQSFLIGAALRTGTEQALRLGVALLSIVISLATMQLLLRHRYREQLFVGLLEASRAQRILARDGEDAGTFDLTDDRLEELAGSRPPREGFVARVERWPAWRVWLALFGAFIALDLFVVAVILV